MLWTPCSAASGCAADILAVAVRVRDGRRVACAVRFAIAGRTALCAAVVRVRGSVVVRSALRKRVDDARVKIYARRAARLLLGGAKVDSGKAAYKGSGDGRECRVEGLLDLGGLNVLEITGVGECLSLLPLQVQRSL